MNEKHKNKKEVDFPRSVILLYMYAVSLLQPSQSSEFTTAVLSPPIFY